MSSLSVARTYVGALAISLAAIALLKNNPPPPLSTATESLTGHSINSWTARAMTGLEGKIPDTTYNTDYVDRLERLWHAKELNAGASLGAKKKGEQLVNEYQQASANGSITHMTIDDYLAESQKRISNTRIDWKTLQQRAMPRNPERMQLVKELTNSLNAKDILAYSLTEFFGSHNAEKNLATKDYLLRTAGLEYVMSVPAVFDTLTSYGSHQFTPPAVADINFSQNTNFSINDLERFDHHELAYRFAARNITNLVAQLTEEELQTLEANHANNKDFLVQYIATAHYRPADARRAAKNSLRDGISGTLGFYAEQLGNHRVKNYADKTLANLTAVYKTPVWNLKPDMPANLFTTQKTFLNGDIKKVYTVRAGDNPSSITRLFN